MTLTPEQKEDAAKALEAVRSNWTVGLLPDENLKDLQSELAKVGLEIGPHECPRCKLETQSD